MKVYIHSDDWYPMFLLSDKGTLAVEVDEEKVKEWKRIFKEFLRAQEEMRVARNNAKKEFTKIFNKHYKGYNGSEWP